MTAIPTPRAPDAPVRAGGVGRWVPYAGLAALTSVLVLQNTKQAMLPRTETPTLWAAEIATLLATLVLRSGIWRDAGWREEQQRLGTIANNFYAPRRDWLTSGFSVSGGVLGGLWWGLAAWSVVLTGIRRAVITRGLADFETATVCGVITGATVGAAIGLGIGQWWESAHRRRRRARSATAGDGRGG